MKANRIFKFLFVISVCGLMFIGGAAVVYFNLPQAHPVTNSFLATKTWLGEWKRSASETEYTENFGRIPMIVTRNKHAYGDYTLVSHSNSNRVVLIDMNGAIVHEWNMPSRKAWPNPTHMSNPKSYGFIETSYLYPNGDLLAQFSSGLNTPYGYGIVKMDKDSNVIWVSSHHAHHDFYVDPTSGDIYAITHRAIKMPTTDWPNLTYPMVADYITRFSADGEELDHISLMDAFKDTPFDLYLYSARGWDRFHDNSIMRLSADMAAAFPMFKEGYILMNSRNMRVMYVVDPETRKVVWAYRGPWATAHAARFLPNGHILYFDNQGHFLARNAYSRVVEFDPKNSGTAWYYAGNHETPLISVGHDRLQRLPNGNTLIGAGTSNRILEVTPDKKIVWNLKLQTQDGWINTALRYTKDELPFLAQ